MVKVFLIILGEWRHFGHILYEKLTYLLSVLPGLVRELSYFVKKLIKSLCSLKITFKKNEKNVKLYLDLHFDFLFHIIRSLDEKDKKDYKRYYEEEKGRREKKLAAREIEAKKKDEWIQNRISTSLNCFRNFLSTREKRMNNWFYLKKMNFERRINKCIKGFYERLLRIVVFKRVKIESINPALLCWEEKRKRKVKWWQMWFKFKSPYFKPFLEKLIQIQDIPPHVQRFIVKWIFDPAVDYLIVNYLKFLEKVEEKNWIRRSSRVERIENRFLLYEEELKKKIELYGSAGIRFWVPRFYFYADKLPEFGLKRNYFYERYQKEVEKHNDWWFNVIRKGRRKEVFDEKDFKNLNVRINLGELHSTYRFFFEIDRKRWDLIERFEKRIIENRIVSFFFRMVSCGYRFFLLLVMSDPFVYAWDVFFLVTGVYILCIIAPIILFFELIRTKKK